MDKLTLDELNYLWWLVRNDIMEQEAHEDESFRVNVRNKIDAEIELRIGE